MSTLKTWKHADMTCLRNHGVYDIPCGFVVLDETHPLYGYESYDEHLSVIDVHGGITFSGEIPNYGWCVGFDMGHLAGDFTPTTPVVPYQPGSETPEPEGSQFGAIHCIRTEAECIAETNKLAEQLKKLAE